MSQVTARDFQRQLGEMQDLAQREPVEILKHGRRHTVLLSAHLYDQLVARARRAYAADEVPDEILEAVKNAKMDNRHNPLNKLLED
jgi:prevent-host-death family protein